jgi:hypothetical protein
MNDDLIFYIKEITKLRKLFSIISHVEKESEVMKIWARWIITHRSVCPQGNLVLPDDETYDSKLILELQDKGVTSKHSIFLHDWLIAECRTINKHFTPTASVEFGGIHGNIPITYAIKNNTVKLTCSGIEQLIPITVYNQMSRTFRPPQLTKKKNGYIWLCAALYGLLDGKGLQWAVPPKVMGLLQTNLGCYTELFASPLNVYNKNYYSLFPIDTVFGSRGNFFTAPDSDFTEGAYQVNPPFIDPLFTKTTNKILELLDIADSAGKELTFVYIMPEWNDFPTYTMVSEARFCVKQIKLHANSHYYYQYGTSSFIRARFGTNIFFLSTNTKCCTHTLEKELIHAFGCKPQDYHSRPYYS